MIPDKVTIREKYEPAMTITDPAKAREYFEACVEHTMRLGKSRAEAEELERSNLGHYAGYYDQETAERVWRLFGAAHPIFGRERPTAAEAVAAGAVSARVGGGFKAAVLASAIARVCHEANRAWCEATGDRSQVAWDDAPAWQRDSCLNGVTFVLAHPDAGDSAQHDNWSLEKSRDGWVYGAVKDPEAMTHPCLVPFNQLPDEQQAKDRLFRAIVLALAQPAK